MLLDDEVLLLALRVWNGHHGLFLHLGAVALGGEDGIDKLRLAAQSQQRVLRGLLLALLLGIADALAALDVLDEHLSDEHGTVLAVALLLQVAELHLDAVLLAPLQQLRLEVDFLVGHLVDVDDLRQDALLHEAHAGVVASVQIDGADESLEGVATHVAVVRRRMPGRLDELCDAHFLRQLAQRVAAHQLRARIGEEALALALETAVHDVAHDGIEDGIAQKLQPLVVQRLALLVATPYTLMQQCLFVMLDVVGVEAQYAEECTPQVFLVLNEQPAAVNEIHYHN